MDLDNTMGLVFGVIFATIGFHFLTTSSGLLRVLSFALMISGIYVCYHYINWDEYMVNG